MGTSEKNRAASEMEQDPEQEQDQERPFADFRDYVPTELLNVTFPAAVRGYERGAVDAYVKRVNRVIAEVKVSASPRAAVRHALRQTEQEVWTGTRSGSGAGRQVASPTRSGRRSTSSMRSGSRATTLLRSSPKRPTSRCRSSRCRSRSSPHRRLAGATWGYRATASSSSSPSTSSAPWSA